MSRDRTDFTAGLEKNPPATESQIREIENQIGISFPPDYRAFISRSNGAEGG